MDTTPLCDGRFVPHRLLGAGSQAQTFEGVDRRDGRAVAIKRFDVHDAASWKDVELAEREARVLSKLEHPALPGYVHHFEHAGALYLVMQKVEGQDLQKLLETGHRFSFDELTRLLEMLAGVFEYLHRRSPPLVHRDIKPSNIVQRPDGSYSLIDFGSVRDGLRPAGGSTVVGTFGYMAPEQFQARALPASDLYGTGATLLTLLTGVTPDKLPHRGLAIDVRAALPTTTPSAWIDLLERLVCIDPDARAVDWAVFLPMLRYAAPASHFAGTSAPRAGASPQTETQLPAYKEASEWMLGSGSTLPFVVIVLLSLLRALLFLVLQVALPTLLMMISVVFGRGLRRTASDVTRAGHDVDWQLALLTKRLNAASPFVVKRHRRIRPTGPFPHGSGPFRREVSPERHGAAKPRRQRVANFDVNLPREGPDDAEAKRRRQR